MARVAMIVWNEFLNDARVLKEAETLQAGGHAVTVFALHTPGRTKRIETLASGVRAVRVPRSLFWKLRHSSGGKGPVVSPAPKIGAGLQLGRIAARSLTHAELLWRMAAFRPDVVHSHDVNTLPTAWLAAVIARAPLIYDAHEISTDREGYNNIRKLIGWMEKRLMPRAAATITTTEARAKFFARAYGIPRPLVLQNRSRLAPNAQSDRLRRELQLSEPWPIVLYQGGLQQGRGLERLIDVAAELENAYFVFAGGGRLATTLLARARQHGIEKRVRFVPTIALNELPEYTASADIGVQPIENTCFNHFTTDSNKLFEYMAAGLPVVASNLPEIRKIVQGRDAGLLVSPGSTGQLLDALRKLIADEALRTRLGRNALRAAAQLSWESQEQELVALYDEVLATYRRERPRRT